MSTKRTVPPPPLVSLPRITTLVASLLVALGSGTNYAYSAYSPQLGSKLGISHTQLNIVGLGANVSSLSSPAWGKIVDSRGPRILFCCALATHLTGYMGMRYFYDRGLPDGTLHISTLAVSFLTVFNLLTGIGGCAGAAASVNSTAKTFPDNVRASTTGLVISGFGLSAFFFSSIAHFFFPGDTSSFLLILALGTSILMIIGFFLVRPIPLPSQEGYNIIPDDNPEDDTVSTALLHHHNTSDAHFQDHDLIHLHHPHYIHSSGDANSHGREAYIPTQPEEIQLNVVQGTDGLDNTDAGDWSTPSRQPHNNPRSELINLPNLYGTQLFKSVDFWLLSSILSILSGTGVMYINNVGSMSQALYAHNTDDYDDTKAVGWQTAQVSTLSLASFLGRIFIGLVSDFVKSKYGIPRSYCLVLVSSLFCISQIVITAIDDINHLWLASSVLGLAYGSVYSLFPTICIEWFGMPHFSENWGFMVMSPLVAGNFFCIIFGWNLDAHEQPSQQSPVPRLTAATSSPPRCLEGKKCYIDTIYITILATLAAILLSIWAGYWDRKKMLACQRKHPEVGWEDGEES